MSRLGQYLCKRGLLTRDQLQEALEHQAVYGARLGSNLVELRMISPEILAECLSDLHHAPLPPRGWLERPGKAAIKRVTRPLVERIRFIPLRYIDKVLHVAVMDPNDPSVLDNLRFATGCRIKSYVMPEIWIHDWLFSLFQIARGIRHIEVDYPAAQAPEGETPLALDLQAMQAAAQKAHKAQDAQAAKAAQNAPAAPTQSAANAQATQALQQSRKRTEQGRPAAPPPDTGADSVPVNMPPAPMPFTADAPWTPGAMAPIPQMGVPMMFPTAGPAIGQGHTPVPALGGESVRPPQIAVRSLADLTGSAGAFVLGAMGDPGAPARGASAFPEREPGTSPLWSPAAADSRWLPAARSEAPPAATAEEEEPSFGYEEDRVSYHDQVDADVAPQRARGESDYPAVYLPEPESEPESEPEPEPEPVFVTEEAESDSGYETSRASPDDDEPLSLPQINTPPPRIKSHVLSPGSFPRVEAAMMQVVDRDRLIELAFSLAGCFASHTALFLVQQGTLQGLRFAERHSPPRPLEGVLVPAGADSMLTRAVQEGKPLRANPEERVIDLRVREMLHDSQCREAALFPIMIKQRVINVLYASYGDESLGEIAFAALSALAERMGAAYERLIRSKKVG